MQTVILLWVTFRTDWNKEASPFETFDQFVICLIFALHELEPHSIKFSCFKGLWIPKGKEKTNLISSLFSF